MEAPQRHWSGDVRSARTPTELTPARTRARRDRPGTSVKLGVCVAAAVLAAVALLQGRSNPSDDRSVELVGAPAAVPAPRGGSSPAPAAIGATSSSALTPSEEDLVTWARHRFSLVGFELPVVDVAFHDDTEPCGGHTGRFRGDSKHRQIEVCVPDRGTFASHLQRQRTLVHELAHAWDHANLDRRDRAELLGILDASDWYAPEFEWEERGVERFAETIVWGLYDQLRRPTLIDVPCGELHADFRAITGFAAPGPLEQVCDPTAGTCRGRSRPIPRPEPRGAET